MFLGRPVECWLMMLALGGIPAVCIVWYFLDLAWAKIKEVFK